MGDIGEVSSVVKGSDSLSVEQQGRGQVGPMRRSQRLVDRQTRQTVVENQEITRKEDASIKKDATAASPDSWSRPRSQTRVPKHLANHELSSSPLVSESYSEIECDAGTTDNVENIYIGVEENEADEDELVSPSNVACSPPKKRPAGSGQTPSQLRTRGRRNSSSEGEGGQEGEKVVVVSGHGGTGIGQCEVCGAVLASDETLPEHWVSINLTTDGVCDICLEDENFFDRFKIHLLKSEDKDASHAMVNVKAELLENSDFNQTGVVINVKEEAHAEGRFVRNPFFSSSHGGSELWVSPPCRASTCQGLMRSSGM